MVVSYRLILIGLFLSILAMNMPTRSMNVEHRSVHTGEIIKIVPLDLPQDIGHGDTSGNLFGLEWTESGLQLEEPIVGLSLIRLNWLEELMAVGRLGEDDYCFTTDRHTCRASKARSVRIVYHCRIDAESMVP